jgi:hypothetical protein
MTVAGCEVEVERPVEEIVELSEVVDDAGELGLDVGDVVLVIGGRDRVEGPRDTPQCIARARREEAEL